ncbi:MAG: hypothetical protein CMN25_11015 [Salinicola sp.]|nr:hypothetical protein [Salinicola sp.]
MFILHSSRTVHVPKAAGMHVSKSFRSKAAPGDVFLTGPRIEIVGAPLRSRVLNDVRGAKSRLGRLIPLKHSSAEELRGFFPRVFDVYRTFCVVREPVARAVSAYTYARNDAKMPAVPRTREAFEAIRSCQSFDEFVQGGVFEKFLDINFLRPQSDFVFDRNGRRLVDEIVPASGLDVALRESFGVEPPPKKENATPDAVRTKVKPAEETVQRLRAAYSVDYERLGCF